MSEVEDLKERLRSAENCIEKLLSEKSSLIEREKKVAQSLLSYLSVINEAKLDLQSLINCDGKWGNYAQESVKRIEAFLRGL